MALSSGALPMFERSTEIAVAETKAVMEYKKALAKALEARANQLDFLAQGESITASHIYSSNAVGIDMVITYLQTGKWSKVPAEAVEP